MAATHHAVTATGLTVAARDLAGAATGMSEDLFRQTRAATELALPANSLTPIAGGLSGDLTGQRAAQ